MDGGAKGLIKRGGVHIRCHLKGRREIKVNGGE